MLNLQNYKSVDEITSLIVERTFALRKGDGEAAFDLSIIYSPWSILKDDIKHLIGASPSKRRFYRRLALKLLEEAPDTDLNSKSILEILRIDS